MRRLASLLAVAAAFAAAADAEARTVVARDEQGRPIRFDVRAANVDVDWYAGVLRNAAHGDEIRSVTVRIVSWRDLARRCSPRASGCYGRVRGGGVVTVPTGEGASAAYTLLHEYAHHIDHSRGVEGVPQPNGTLGWWRARGMRRLLEAGRVAHDYSLGWERSIGEIYAEDYVQLHLRYPYRIEWLRPPSAVVKAAIRRDLETPPRAPTLPPLVIVRSGTLAPGEAESVPFGLLGPGRRVTFTAQVAPAPETRARLEVTCERRRYAVALGRGERSATIDERGLGPGSCSAAFRSASPSPLRYTLRLRLSIER